MRFYNCSIYKDLIGYVDYYKGWAKKNQFKLFLKTLLIRLNLSLLNFKHEILVSMNRLSRFGK